MPAAVDTQILEPDMESEMDRPADFPPTPAPPELETESAGDPKLASSEIQAPDAAPEHPPTWAWVNTELALARRSSEVSCSLRPYWSVVVDVTVWYAGGGSPTSHGMP
jgi:hypothetical protein